MYDSSKNSRGNNRLLQSFKTNKKTPENRIFSQSINKYL